MLRHAHGEIQLTPQIYVFLFQGKLRLCFTYASLNFKRLKDKDRATATKYEEMSLVYCVV